MFEITVKVQAPELAAAINNLAAAINGAKQTTSTPVQAAPQYPAAPPVTPVHQYPTTAGLPPVQQQMPQFTAPPTSSVPVAPPPSYSHEQLMTAGAALVDAGKMGELTALLGTFGVQAVTQLKQEQLGQFATEMRKLGANI